MLDGKKIIITGASRGIGKSILENFSKNGASIIACSKTHSVELLKYYSQIETENNVKIYPYFFDLADDEQVNKNLKEILSEHKIIDVLINNAGEIQTSIFLMTPIKKIKDNFNINYFSVLSLTQTIAKKMMGNKSGNIINISTTSAMDGIEGRLAYSSSKAALITTTKVLSKELGRFNIRVNAIAPGLTDTDLMHNSHSPEIIKEVINSLSLNRLAKPDEIANVALFLASELSSYITGEVIRVDGGMK